MNTDLEKLIEVFSLNKDHGLSDELSAKEVYSLFKSEGKVIVLGDFYKMPYEMAMNLIPLFIAEYGENRNARNMILIFRLYIIKDELIAKQADKTSGNEKKDDKDNNRISDRSLLEVLKVLHGPSLSKINAKILSAGFKEQEPSDSYSLARSLFKPLFAKFTTKPNTKNMENKIKPQNKKQSKDQDYVGEVLRKAIKLYTGWLNGGFDNSIAILQAYKYIKLKNVTLKRIDYMHLPYEMAMGVIDYFIKDCRSVNPTFAENKELRRLIWDKSYIKMDHDYAYKPKNNNPKQDSNKEPETKYSRHQSPFANLSVKFIDDVIKESQKSMRSYAMDGLNIRSFLSVPELDYHRLFVTSNRRCKQYEPYLSSLKEINKELLRLQLGISDKDKKEPSSKDSIDNSLKSFLLHWGIDLDVEDPKIHVAGLSLNPYAVLGDFIFTHPIEDSPVTSKDSAEDTKESTDKEPQPSTEETILQEATRILGGDRQADYGDPVRNFINIAKEVNRWSDKEITPLDCVNVLIATKTCREQFKHKRDNQVDLVAYQEIKRRIIDWCAVNDWKAD